MFYKNSEEIRYQLADGKLQVTSIDAYMKNLKASIEKKAASKVVVVAHSHGGWVALQVLLKKYIPTKQISLITIDPISMKNCTSSKFMMGLTGILPDFLKDQSCKEAPSDISRSQYRQIASSVSDWTNYYQLQFQYLHSGP